MDSLGPTLDFVDGAEEEDVDEERVSGVWGWLFPLSKYFGRLDLVKDEYTFGRDKSCDHCLDSSDGRKNPNLAAFSKVHFRLFRERDPKNPDKYVVFLHDKSSNGTFVNGDKIGRNKTQVLNNNDEIALSHAKYKSFIFHDRDTDPTEALPEAMKETYSVSKLLGRGACGEVKLAFKKDSCERYAVKIISKKTFSVGPQIGPSVMDEVNIMKKLSHPCVISIEDVYETSEKVYIILELMEGGELFDRVVKVGKFDESTARVYFYQMLTAVKYLHDKGITHRDMKPENVLLTTEDPESLIKVTDFGLSRFVGEQSLMKTLCGTPTYLAPEVLTNAGLSGYTKAVDCWSLGVILYVCLGGYPPFSDENEVHSLHDQITKGMYSFPDKYWKRVSAEGKDLIKKLLTVDPRQRIGCNGALKHPWMKDRAAINRAKALMYPDQTSPGSMPPPAAIPRHRKRGSNDDNKASPAKRQLTEPTSESPTSSSSSSVATEPSESQKSEENATSTQLSQDK